MFATLSLARQIDLAEASLSADLGEASARRDPAGAFVRALGGGVAVYAGPSSPMNKIIGAGFDGPPAPGELTAVEEAFFERGAPVRAEVASLADPEWCRLLTARGYQLHGFENVLGRDLSVQEPNNPAASGIIVTLSADRREWMDVVVEGFAAPDTGVVSAPGESFPREAVEQAMADVASARGFVQYVAQIDGRIVGGASQRITNGVAQLCGAATLPPFRRRGVQSALLYARLHDARRAGCTIAVVTTEPGSKSQENVQRSGFELLYTRAILINERG
jgi:GNAT superfamily N-acetyltransferase